MDQVEIDGMLQEAKKYEAEKYLAEAAKLLKRNKKIDIEIVDCMWYVNEIANKPVFKILYSFNGHGEILRVSESVFKDYQRKVDTKIGIKPEMKMEHKIILRLAYLLYTHRED